MNDPSGLAGGQCHQFEHESLPVGADHQKAVFAVVVVLDQPDGIDPSVMDVCIGDPVPSSRLPDLHRVNVNLTVAYRQGLIDEAASGVIDPACQIRQ